MNYGKNIIGKDYSLAKIVRSLSTIKDEESYNKIFKDYPSKETLFFGVYQEKDNKENVDFISISILAVIANNEYLLNTLLKNNKNALSSKEYLYIKERTHKYGSFNMFDTDEDNTLLDKFSFNMSDFKKMSDLQQHMEANPFKHFVKNIAYNENIQKLLNEYNLFEDLVTNIADNDTTFNKMFKKTLVNSIFDFYQKNEKKFENIDLYYQKIEFDIKESFFNDQDNFENLKNNHKCLSGDNNHLCENERLIQMFIENPAYLFWKDFFKHHNINNTGNLHTIDKINLSFKGKEDFIKHNYSLDFFSKIEPFIMLNNTLIKDCKKFYDAMFQKETNDFTEFYTYLSDKYGYETSVDMLSIKNMDNIKKVIELKDSPLTGKECSDLIMNMITKLNISHLKEFIEFSNVNKKSVSEEIIKTYIKNNNKNKVNDVVEFLDHIHSSVEMDSTKISTKRRNEITAVVENYILAKTMSVTPNRAKNIKRI